MGTQTKLDSEAQSRSESWRSTKKTRREPIGSERHEQRETPEPRMEAQSIDQVHPKQDRTPKSISQSERHIIQTQRIDHRFGSSGGEVRRPRRMSKEPKRTRRVGTAQARIIYFTFRFFFSDGLPSSPSRALLPRVLLTTRWSARFVSPSANDERSK